MYILAPEEEADLENIWCYIARESGSTDKADRLVDAITERFYLLSAYPRLGRKRDELRPGLHRFAVDDYIIIYRITANDDVLILHVPHSRHDLPRIVGS